MKREDLLDIAEFIFNDFLLYLNKDVSREDDSLDSLTLVVLIEHQFGRLGNFNVLNEAVIKDCLTSEKVRLFSSHTEQQLGRSTSFCSPSVDYLTREVVVNAVDKDSIVRKGVACKVDTLLLIETKHFAVKGL